MMPSALSFDAMLAAKQADRIMCDICNKEVRYGVLTCHYHHIHYCLISHPLWLTTNACKQFNFKLLVGWSFGDETGVQILFLGWMD